MNTEPTIYVACLAAYNGGKLHGVRIECDGKDAADIQEEVNAMLAESPEPGAEEWAIHDSEGFAGIEIGEHETFENVSKHAAMLAEHGEAWAAYVRVVGDHYATPEGFQEAYRGTYSSKEDFAETFADDTGLLSDMPDNLRGYFDWRAFARDLFMDGYRYDEETGAVFADY